MKSGLGDDQEDGWLLLGGQGVRPQGGGSGMPMFGATTALSAHERLAAAASSSFLSGGESGGGPFNGKGAGDRPAQYQR